MANVTLLRYNNYFNRIIKKESSYNAYLTAASAFYTYQSINFVPADGVTTSLVIDTSTLASMNYDYLIVSHTSSGSEVIDSRWFIMDENRLRNGQYKIGLRRDVIIDNYSVVMSAPIFLEKGYVGTTTDALLYNSESMTYNQIKESEKLITDSTECAWVVGYIPQDAFQLPTTISKDIPTTPTPDITVSSLSSWSYWDAVSTNTSGHIWATDSSISKVLQLKWKI